MRKVGLLSVLSLLPLAGLAQDQATRGGDRVSTRSDGTVSFRDGLSIEVDRTRPDIGGRDSRERPSSASPVRTTAPDPYPALTRANNAYTQAVAVWQKAFQNYQTALRNQAAIRGKYVDANNTVRPGYDYYAAVAVVRAADKEAEDAYFELSQAEKARNAAHGRARDEFRIASEQFARAERERAEAAAREQAAKEARWKAIERSDRRGDFGGR